MDDHYSDHVIICLVFIGHHLSNAIRSLSTAYMYKEKSGVHTHQCNHYETITIRTYSPLKQQLTRKAPFQLNTFAQIGILYLFINLELISDCKDNTSSSKCRKNTLRSLNNINIFHSLEGTDLIC